MSDDQFDLLGLFSRPEEENLLGIRRHPLLGDLIARRTGRTRFRFSEALQAAQQPSSPPVIGPEPPPLIGPQPQPPLRQPLIGPVRPRHWRPAETVVTDDAGVVQDQVPGVGLRPRHSLGNIPVTDTHIGGIRRRPGIMGDQPFRGSWQRAPNSTGLSRNS